MNELAKQWNNFVVEHGPRSGAFLHSWEWGDFQTNLGRQVYRFVLTESGPTWINAEFNAELHGNILGVMQVIKVPLPLKKNYLYVPRGPIIISDFRFQISDFKNELQQLTKKERAIFMKIELSIEEKNIDKINLQPTTYNLQPKSIQPHDTLILDLSKSEEELLTGMHEKTRYNIKLAERKGVQVRWATAETLEKDLENFWRLAQETAKRDRFSYHPKSYYQKMLNMNNESSRQNKFSTGQVRIMNYDLTVKLVIAEEGGETLATNIVVFFGNTVTYLHGASNYARRELMAPYLLQWRTIQEAKRLEYKYYDFWGISPQQNVIGPHNNTEHPWIGITRFKLGFGGEVVSYAPTLDLTINNFWYKLYRLGKLLLKS